MYSKVKGRAVDGGSAAGLVMRLHEPRQLRWTSILSTSDRHSFHRNAWAARFCSTERVAIGVVKRGGRANFAVADADADAVAARDILAAGLTLSTCVTWTPSEIHPSA